MADSTTNLEQIETSQAQKEVTANGLFDAVSPSSLFGRHAETCIGLTWGYYGGRYDGAEVDNGTLTLSASSTSYIVVRRSTLEVSITSGSPNEWDDTATYARLYKIVTGTATVTSYEDHRLGPTGIFGGGGGTGMWGGITGTLSDQTDLQAALDSLELTADGSTLQLLASVLSVKNNGVSYAKMQDVSATSRILGRKTAGSGDPEECTLSEILDFIGSAARGDILYRGSSTWARLAAGTAGQVLKTNGAGADPAWGWPEEVILIALGDEATAVTAGTAKVTFRMPYAFTVTAIRGSLSTAQTSGSIFTIDVNESGTTILSTKLTFDNTEKTTTTAATAAVISDTSLADDAEMTFDVDQVGDGTAKGPKIAIYGHRT